MRDECLSANAFASLTEARLLSEARLLIEAWRIVYNEERPHMSLGYLTPAEFKQQWRQSRSSTTGD